MSKSRKPPLLDVTKLTKPDPRVSKAVFGQPDDVTAGGRVGETTAEPAAPPKPEADRKPRPPKRPAARSGAKVKAVTPETHALPPEQLAWFFVPNDRDETATVQIDARLRDVLLDYSRRGGRVPLARLIDNVLRYFVVSNASGIDELERRRRRRTPTIEL